MLSVLRKPEFKIEFYIYFLFLLSLGLYIAHYHFSKPLLHLAAFIGFLVIVLKPGKAFTLLNKIDFLWLIAILLMPLNSLLFYWQYGYELDYERFLFTFEISLVASVLYLSIRKLPKRIMLGKDENFLHALAVCGLLGGAAALYSWWQSGFTIRVSQGTNLIIIFATVVSVCALTSLYGLVYFYKTKRLLALFYFFSFGVSLTASIASGSKGPWLAMVLVLGLWWLKLLFTGNFKKAIVFFSGIILLIVFAGSFGNVSQRIADAFASSKRYFSASQEKVIDGSIGIRVEQWKAGLHKIYEKPLQGHGSQPFSTLFKDLVDKDKVSSGATVFDHIHNSYLQSWLTFGVLGLLQMALLIFLPFLLFYRSDQGLARSCGLVIILAFAISALTDDPFIRYFSLNFYILCISFLLATVANNCSVKKNNATGKD